MSSQCSLRIHDKSSCSPKIHPTAFIDLTAKICGNVEIGPNVYVGPNVVIRADERGERCEIKPIVIGENTNIQDGVVIHSHAGHSVNIGKNCCLTHGSLVHGPCNIGDGCFIGFKSIVFMADLADGVFVHAGCVVQNVKLAEKTMVPAASSVTEQGQADKLGAVVDEVVEPIKKAVKVNRDLVKGYSNI